MDTYDPIRALAAELIASALVDIKQRQNKRKTYTQDDYAEQALLWFNRRDTSPMGYGWALRLTHLNPNRIRQKINYYYYTRRRRRW